MLPVNRNLDSLRRQQEYLTLHERELEFTHGFLGDTGGSASLEKARVSRRMPPSANDASAASARYARSGVHGTLRTTASGHAPGPDMRFALRALEARFAIR